MKQGRDNRLVVECTLSLEEGRLRATAVKRGKSRLLFVNLIILLFLLVNKGVNEYTCGVISHTKKTKMGRATPNLDESKFRFLAGNEF